MTEPDDAFLEIFRDEANERLDRMVETLLALEAGRAEPDAVDVLFREAHTIKGAAGMVGLAEIRSLAHAIEDVLATVRDVGVFPPELADPLMRSADALRSQVAGEEVATKELVEELASKRTALVDGHGAKADRRPRKPRRVAVERRSVRVPAGKLDEVLNLVGETVLHRRRLEHVLGELSHAEEIADELGLGERLFDELKDTAIGMRTLPLSSITGPFPRAVRDIAAAEDKEVELIVDGAETELDRIILEGLSEPIVHLLRNAIAHGIELPDDRERAGKPRRGTVELRAEQRGGFVAVTVVDDGRGVSAESVRAAAEGGSLADVLARVGFSTADEVTELAGRGVGLGAVKAQVQEFGGRLEARSEPGRGMEIELLLPLTLALLDVLLVERAGQAFALPLASVEEAVSVDERLWLGGKPAIELRGQSIALADLAELVGAVPRPGPEHAPAIVVSAAGRRVAALCDRLLGEEEVVVKSLGPLLAQLDGYLGAAILGDGRIALILDPSMLTRGPRLVSPRGVPTPPPEQPVSPKVLVVEDSFTVRELQRSILESAGYRVATARDGREGFARVTDDEEIGLVVTDVEMPEMDGLELTRAIRAQPERSSLPVIIVTTRAAEEDRQRGMEAGADAYMAKRSFDQQALLETVERLIGR